MKNTYRRSGITEKGDLRECKNYRGMMSLSVPRKVLNRAILGRLKTAVDLKLSDHQAGSAKKGQIVILRIIIEQSIEWNYSI